MNSDLCLHLEKFWLSLYLYTSIFYFILLLLFKIRIRADLWLWTLEINALTIHLPPSFQISFSRYLSWEDARGEFYCLSNNADICGLFTGKGVFWAPEREPSNDFIWLYAFRILAEQGALIMINNAAIFPLPTFHLFLTSALWDGLGVIVNILGAA